MRKVRLRARRKIFRFSPKSPLIPFRPLILVHTVLLEELFRFRQRLWLVLARHLSLGG